MNKPTFILVASALLILGLAGCESTGGITARTQEKSAAYATLKAWEKKYIARGAVAVGFTPDMVYMALGSPTTVAVKDLPAGPAELWTYRRTYPNADSIRGFKHVNLTIESAYQSSVPANLPSASASRAASPTFSANAPPPQEPHSGQESISKAGAPQGGTMEPADLTSYTIQVLFENGQVARLSAVPNAN